MYMTSPDDDCVVPTLRAKAKDAFARLDKAHATILRLALRLDDGDGAADFPGLNADALIRKAVGEMHAARYEADEALCSLMKGEEFRLRPTSQTQAVEMQARLIRNDRMVAQARPSVLPAVCSFAAE